jgi:hypothetical protein
VAQGSSPNTAKINKQTTTAKKTLNTVLKTDK